MSTESLFERLERKGALPGNVKPEEAMSAVMCTLFQRLSMGEVRHVVMTMSADLQSLFKACAMHRDEQARPLGRDEFLDEIVSHLKIGRDDAARLAMSVFQEVQGLMTAREIKDVTGQLPLELHSLWLHKPTAVATPPPVDERIVMDGAIRGQPGKTEKVREEEFAQPKDVASPSEPSLVMHTAGGEMPDVGEEGKIGKSPLTEEDSKKAS